MIVDHITQKSRYYGLNPKFVAAFEFLDSWATGSFPEGFLDLPGGLRAIVQNTHCRPIEDAKFEYHRIHADLQYCVQGQERCGWSLAPIDYAAHPFNVEKDAGLLPGPIEHLLSLQSGHFSIFFPGELHAPLIGDDFITKIVVKIPLP